MRKVIIILIIGSVLASCTIAKRMQGYDIKVKPEISRGNILNFVRNNNLTNNGFIIQKAEIELVVLNEKKLFLASIKFVKPDKYLFILKTRAGIEAARIYVSNDTILINDRINRRFYRTNSLYLKRNFGISAKLIPLIFGDMVMESSFKNEDIDCNENFVRSVYSLYGLMLNFKIDCARKKIIQVNEVGVSSGKSFVINYYEFMNKGSLIIPEFTEFNERNGEAKLKVRILKVESPWEGVIKLIPGKGYEIIDLI